MKSNILYLQRFIAACCMLACITACKRDKSNDMVVVTATGNINSKVDEFRQLLGATLNTAPGAVGGRREINWEAVPDSLLGKAMPGNFFNPVGNDPALASRQKGLVYEPGTGEFMVSNTKFANVNAETASGFDAFSGTKTFANVGKNLWPVDPQVPGANVAATVKGFGVVFSDVDVATSTFIEFFNEGKSLGRFFAPVHDNTSSLSFLGVYFKNEKVTRIMVGHDGILIQGGKDISNGGTKDFIILDDFLYDEPVAK
jgi:hypothetical protein